MSNVRKINQDNVLGEGEEELSPSEFGPGIDGQERDDEPMAASKKKPSLLPLVGGIVVAIGLVGFFGWKIVTPYLGGNSHGRDTFAPISAPVPHPQPFGPETAEPQILAPGQAIQTPIVTPRGAPTDALPAQAVAPAAPQPQYQLAGQKVSGDKTTQAPSVAEKPASAPLGVQAPPTSAEEIAQINKRIDGLGAALSSLKDTVEKLQAEMQKTRVAVAAKPAPIQAHVAAVAKPVSSKPAVPAVTMKKPAQPAVAVAVAKKPAEGSKPETPATDSKPSGDVQLQAVLQDRAWFKTKAGETITVSVGEEVKGVGVVQQIDADSGSVIFPNGIVYR